MEKTRISDTMVTTKIIYIPVFLHKKSAQWNINIEIASTVVLNGGYILHLEGIDLPPPSPHFCKYGRIVKIRFGSGKA